MKWENPWAPGSRGVPALFRDEVHVWRAVVDQPVSAHTWSLLSRDEKVRARCLRSRLSQIRWIWAHAALRDILSRYTDLWPLCFQVDLFGKPRLCGSSDLTFSLSHAGKWALIAIARRAEVGVDVEKVRDDIDLRAIARSAFSPVERAALSQLDDHGYVESFYCCWTRKEAVVKALSLGLSADLSAFDVSVTPASAHLLAVRPPLRCSPSCTLMDIALGDDYKAAVAMQGRGEMLCRLLNWS